MRQGLFSREPIFATMSRFLSLVALICAFSNLVLSQSTCELPGLFAPLFACGDPVSFDGYDYATVAIGDQCWFQQNLRNDHYANGDAIPGELSNSDWSNTTSGAQDYYQNNTDHLNDYGRLYNWYAVDDARGLCPSGWHVPTDEEFQVLEAHLGTPESELDNWGWRGFAQNVGGQLKATGTEFWNSDNGGQNTNSSGFTALGAGYRTFDGGFSNWRISGFFWSASPHHGYGGNAISCILNHDATGVYRSSSDRRGGFSVRCVRD